MDLANGNFVQAGDFRDALEALRLIEPETRPDDVVMVDGTPAQVDRLSQTIRRDRARQSKQRNRRKMQKASRRANR